MMMSKQERWELVVAYINECLGSDDDEDVIIKGGMVDADDLIRIGYAVIETDGGNLRVSRG